MYNKKYNQTNPNLQIKNNLYCIYCGKQCKNNNSLTQHQLRCKANPERRVFNNLSNRGWAKGLTKYTDNRILNNSNSKKDYFQEHEGSFKGKFHTQETKDKLSKIQTEIDHSDHNRNSHGKRGYYNNVFFMSTWELAYYIYISENFPQQNIIRCKKRFKYKDIEGKNHYYTPDFIVNNTQFIEIKGWETDLDKIKYSVVPNLTVLYYDDLYDIIKYVQRKYKVEDISQLYS